MINLNEMLEKAKDGEGSRGGKVIGHTKSGKPIYDSGRHVKHTSFSTDDHKDAVDAHYKEMQATVDKINKFKKENPGKLEEQPNVLNTVHGSMKAHHKALKHHQKKANAEIDLADREKVIREDRRRKADPSKLSYFERQRLADDNRKEPKPVRPDVFKSLLEKAKGGEGSRGGTVIGHTKSGKPIYSKGHHIRHSLFDDKDHKSAASLHYDIYSKAQEKLDTKRESDPTYKAPKGVNEFLTHHHTQMRLHHKKANSLKDGIAGVEKKKVEDKVRSEMEGGKAKDKPEKTGSSELPKLIEGSAEDITRQIESLRRRGKAQEAKALYRQYFANKASPLIGEGAITTNVNKGGPGSGRKKSSGKIEPKHFEPNPTLRDKNKDLDRLTPEQIKTRNAERDRRKKEDIQAIKEGREPDYNRPSNRAHLELGKSGYEGYNPGDNFHRKKGNIETGQSTEGAVGRRTKRYGGSGADAAGKVAREARRKSKKNPVKVFSPEEIAQYNKQMNKALGWLAKGKALPVGTTRTWKGRDYVKHADGWKPAEKKKKPLLSPQVDKIQKIREGHGQKITFLGPNDREYSGHIYGEPSDGKVILKFEGIGYRNIPISSMKNIHIEEISDTLSAKPLDKGKSDGWPPSGFKEPERKGTKTVGDYKSLWYESGSRAKAGRPSTKGKLSGKTAQYKSPEGSTCNLVGEVAFGKASVKAQKQLNTKIQMTEMLLSDMGIRLKTPIDFMCQDMEDSRQGVMAQFIPMNGVVNDQINLAKNLKTANKSILHEIGHSIDYAMENAGMAGSYFRGNPTEFKEEFDKLTDILRESKFYEATGAKDAPGNVDDDLLEPDTRFANYLKDQSEVFARAFEVYTYGHALDMVAKDKLPADYTDHFVPDFLKAGYSMNMIDDPEKFKKVVDDVTTVMDKIFNNRAIQKALQELDLYETLKKNVISTDDQGSATETGDYANDLYANGGHPLMDQIKDALEGHMYGVDPVEIMIGPDRKLVAVKTDEGVYSGHVKRIKDGEEENILKIEKQTLPTLLQMLKIKEIIEPKTEPKKKINSDYKMKVLELLTKLV